MKKEKETIKEEKIAFWEIWSNNFYNARRFFTSKGNLKTRAKLKAKWLNKFIEDIENFFQ